MKPAPFSYSRPTTLDEALASLAADPDAKVLAGGQSLVPLLSMRLALSCGKQGIIRVKATTQRNRVGGLTRVMRYVSMKQEMTLVRHWFLRVY